VCTADDELLPVVFADGDLAEYAQQAQSLSLYDMDVDVSQAKAILTLSTCTDDRWHGRLLISAIRVDNMILDQSS
jgi:hypothetical protein